MANALSDQERALIDAYWRAANYLSVGQIYLYGNPLLRKPLAKDHIKPRLLGVKRLATLTPGLRIAHFASEGTTAANGDRKKRCNARRDT
jgi:phosphoketolase